jgi:hypothetical protein
MKTFEQIYVESGTNATMTIGYSNIVGELRVMSKKIEQQGGVRSWGSFVYDGDTGVLSLGDHQMGIPGKIVMGGSTTQSVLLDAATNTLALGGIHAGYGTVRLKNLFGTESAVMSAESATLTLGKQTALPNDTANGKIVLNRTDGSQTVVLDGATGNLTLGGGTQDGDVTIKSANGATAITMAGSDAVITVGGNGLNGDIRIKDSAGAETVYLDGENGNLTLGGGTKDGDLTIRSSSGKPSIVLAGSDGIITVGGEGVNGDIFIKNSNDIETIKITGSNGDIEFLNADVAEEFEIHAEDTGGAVPGTVMVLEDSGRLKPCSEAYDSRVVGIIAGAGQFRPGIVLDRNGGRNRRAIALIGKTYCYVDAAAGPIRVGDMLTTSPLAGHAMRASDRQKAFGAVIGKALEPLSEGIGLIPVLVKPQ